MSLNQLTKSKISIPLTKMKVSLLIVIIVVAILYFSGLGKQIWEQVMSALKGIRG